MDIRRLDRSEWAGALPDSGFEPFHTPAGLSTLADHTEGELRLYGGFKGQHPVGLWPAFVRDQNVGRAVLSPPPSMAVPRLGPIVMAESPKQRKREKVNRTFTTEVLDRLDADASRTLFYGIVSTTYGDPRPFTWAGMDVEPAFTYHVDVDDRTPDELLASFSRDLRKDVTNGEDLAVTVDREGVEGARPVYQDVVARYDAQGETFGPSWPYVRDAVEAFGDRARVYVARDPDGEFLNGMIFLYSNDAAYSWLGGTKRNYDSVATKSLVQWAMLTDLVEDPPFESIERYDMTGANTERICRYKAAFGGELVPYYMVESGGATMDIAKRAYRMVRG